MVHKKWKLDVPDEHQLGFCIHQPTAEKPQIKMTTPDHCVEFYCNYNQFHDNREYYMGTHGYIINHSYQVEHEKRNFIYTSNHDLCFLVYCINTI